MRTIKRYICCLLACLTAFSLVACGDKETASNDISNSSESNNSGTSEQPEILEETIVRYGNTEYQILIPEICSGEVSTAASELAFFVKESTGVSLPIITDASYNSSGKYISLGDTKLASEQNLSVSHEQVGAQGYWLKTLTDDIYILGTTGKGILNGVYGWLEVTLNYDYFYTDVYSIDKSPTLKLLDYDIYDMPDLGINAAGWGYQSGITAARMRMSQRNASIMTAPSGANSHTSLSYLPYDTYGKSIEEGGAYGYEDWYIDDKANLCYTAHGNEELYNAMVETAAEILFNDFRADANQNQYIASFSGMDTSSWCACNACKEIIDRNYGANSATLILFIKDLAANLKAKFAAVEDPRAETFMICYLTYLCTQDAPVAKVEGEYVYSEEVLCNKHVVPLYAPIYTSYPDSIHDVINTQHKENYFKWAAISQKVLIWNYDTYFGNYMAMYDTYGTIGDLYQFVDQFDVEYYYNQAQWGNPAGVTGFGLLRGYLASKLGWESSLDVPTLIDKFFIGMYGSEAGNVRAIFDEMRVYNHYQRNELGMFELVYAGNNPANTNTYSKSVLLSWVERLQEIEKRLEANGETLACVNVQCEVFGPMMILLDLYRSTLTPEQLDRYLEEISAYQISTGISYWSEGLSITAKLAEWKKN